MSKSEKINRICKEICKKFQVKRPVSGKRYSSGQGHCQTCDTWLDHNGCHMKDGTAAQSDSVGWFCNCCNYRVRQRPRSRNSKEILENENKQISQKKEMGDEIYSEDKILPEDLYIGKKQAILLKNISLLIPNRGSELDVLKIIDKISDSVQFEIKDNWGSWENFFELATNYDELNKISSIILFEKLNNQIGKVATKKEYLETVNINEEWIDKEFKSWENLLELLGHDPWYRNNSNKVLEKILSEKIIKKELAEYENTKLENEESIEDIIQKVNNIKSELSSYYKLKDSEENFIDYSYVEMFQLLEKYLKILPNNPKYFDIRELF